MKKSHARNHHFISQVEQRLNAIDQGAKPENQRIYEFEVVNPDPPSIRNVDVAGKKIEKNLARQDLYALKMLKGGGQHNLEGAFQQYENDISLLTKSFLEKLQNPDSVDFKVEVLRLYLLKFLNSFRNPYGIKSTLDMLRALDGVLPGNEELQKHFLTIDEGDRKQAERICKEFDITETEYISWLKAIYLLILQPLDQGLNLIEHLVKGLVENENYIKDITVFCYEGEHGDAGVLLCDRGIVEGNVDSGVLLQQFNLDASTFVSFMFVDLDRQNLIPLNEKHRSIAKMATNSIRVHNIRNDLKMLETYNKYCVWQAHSKVYCAKQKPYGVNVLE
ncbi:hypothetical protein [Azotobacter vinelandii]